MLERYFYCFSFVFLSEERTEPKSNAGQDTKSLYSADFVTRTCGLDPVASGSIATL